MPPTAAAGTGISSTAAGAYQEGVLEMSPWTSRVGDSSFRSLLDSQDGLIVAAPCKWPTIDENRRHQSCFSPWGCAGGSDYLFLPASGPVEDDDADGGEGGPAQSVGMQAVGHRFPLRL